METKTIISKQGSLNVRNWLKGLLMAAGTPVLLKIQQTIDSGVLEFDWKDLGMVAISAAATYLLSKLLEASKKITIEPVSVNEE